MLKLRNDYTLPYPNPVSDDLTRVGVVIGAPQPPTEVQKTLMLVDSPKCWPLDPPSPRKI